MFCTSCGVELREGDKYCSQCAHPTSRAAVASIPRAGEKQLYRVREGKKIAGVCGGFARYFDLDVTLVRIVWLILAFASGGAGFIGYLVAWIAMPKEPDTTSVAMVQPVHPA
jgi:phage shock protein C